MDLAAAAVPEFVTEDQKSGASDGAVLHRLEQLNQRALFNPLELSLEMLFQQSKKSIYVCFTLYHPNLCVCVYMHTNTRLHVMFI